MTISASTPHTNITAARTSGSRRFVVGVASALSLGLVAGACGSDASTLTADAVADQPVTSVVSAAEGAAARSAQAAALGTAGVFESAEAPAASSMVADSISGMCIGEPYVPTAEEIASANADIDALAAALAKYGITYEVITDDLGFTYVETDYSDVVAQAVVDSFWQARYPVDVEIVDVVDVEPIGPTAEDLALIKADNDKLAAGFDAAGIAYTRVSDDLGWEWIEWDYDDESVQEAVMAVFDDVYPVDPAVDPLPCDDTVVLEDTASMDNTVSIENSAVESAPEGLPVDGAAETPEMRPDDVVVADDGFTDEQVAQRDAEVAAMESGFSDANVEYTIYGESPWASVVFDIDNDAAVGVISGVLTSRG